MDATPLYSSRNPRAYIEYLKAYRPDVDDSDIQMILFYSGISNLQLMDDGYWCTQRQIDRFHEKLDEIVKDPDISRKVGRFNSVSKAYGTIRTHILQTFSTSQALKLMGRIARGVTRQFNVEINILGPQKAEIITTPKTDFEERKYICDNRIGNIEAYIKILTGEYGKIEHPDCIHRGDSRCRYIVNWIVPRSLKWKRIMMYGIFLIPFTFGTTLYLDPDLLFLTPISAIPFLVGGFYHYYLQNNELESIISIQKETAEALIEQMNKNYNNTALIREISRAVSSLQDLPSLIELAGC